MNTVEEDRGTWRRLETPQEGLLQQVGWETFPPDKKRFPTKTQAR